MSDDRGDSGENPLQNENRSWWQHNPMNYDWERTLALEEGSAAFYDEIDARLFASSRFYAGDPPFNRIIPFGRLSGKKVLEIGCGLGSHAELFCLAGADLTAIDITDRAIKDTRRRLELRGLEADVHREDAEAMSFADETFDFVWSWGVIHHSASPESILDEIHRVLRPGGEVRLMVYHRRSIEAAGKIARGFLTGRYPWKMSRAETLNFYCDGFVARHYTRSELSKTITDAGFERVSTAVFGQDIEVLPLPGVGPVANLKQRVAPHIPRTVVESLLSRWGWFLFACGRKPGTPAGGV